ncbi:MAG: elongation factor Ts [Bacteroidetes bacterium]|nr:elongation factor Ts [Bacteroidota bacterium]
MAITAAEVNKLRQMTGAGMMDCKNALVENDGDFDKAIDFLRKKGQKLASKRADRDANEGVVIAKTNADKTFAATIMINCETDFVAKTDLFINFCKSVLDLAIEKMPKSEDELKAMQLEGVSIADLLIEQTGKTGEKVELAHYNFIEAPMNFAYNHQGSRLATIVGFNKTCDEVLGKDIAMQIASMAPVAIDKESVSAETIEKELEIYRDLIRQEGKPENMVEQIAQGKLNKFFKDSTLLNQDFIKEGKKSVEQHIKEIDKDLKVTAFIRLMLGA